MKVYQSGKGCKYSHLDAGGIFGSKQFSLSNNSTDLVLESDNGIVPGSLGSGSNWEVDDDADAADDDDDDNDDGDTQCSCGS